MHYPSHLDLCYRLAPNRKLSPIHILHNLSNVSCCTGQLSSVSNTTTPLIIDHSVMTCTTAPLTALEEAVLTSLGADTVTTPPSVTIVPASANSPAVQVTIDKVCSLQEEALLRDRMRQSLSERRHRLFDRKIEEWIDFLVTRGFTGPTDHFLQDFSRVSKLKLVILFIMSIEARNLPTQSYVQALREHFRTSFQPEDIFRDWVLSQARKTVSHGRTLSLQREAHIRLPTPIEFIHWLRDTYFLPAVPTNDAAKMMIYVAVALAYNKGLRASEYCVSGDSDHAITAADVFLEGTIGDDTYVRYQPHDLLRRTHFPVCTTEEARAASAREGRSNTVYFAVRRGFQRGVFASKAEYLQAITNYRNADCSIHSSRISAAAFCADPTLDIEHEVDTSVIERIVFIMRSEKTRRNGETRRIVLTRPHIAPPTAPDDESVLVSDIITFIKAAHFTQDTSRPFFSRLLNLRVLKLSRVSVSSALKDAAVHFDFDPALFSSHCNRIAAATALAQAGYGEEEIRRYIGWAGRSSLRYERDFLRPSTLRLQSSGALSVADVRTLAPSVRCPSTAAPTTPTVPPPPRDPRNPRQRQTHTLHPRLSAPRATPAQRPTRATNPQPRANTSTRSWSSSPTRSGRRRLIPSRFQN